MIRTLSLSFLVLAAPAVAQEATNDVRNGCTVVPAADSLRAQPTFPIVYLPDEDGVINIEIESVPPTGGWSQETTLPGYRGSSYYRWNGGNQFSNPGLGTLTYLFRIEEAGQHLIRLRNQHNDPDPTMENDAWYSFNDGPWIKWVDSWGPSGINIWSFNAFLEPTEAFAQEFLSTGVHKIEISGRSQNFKVDSIHVVPTSVWLANAVDPPAQIERERPIIGTTMTFQVGDPYGLTSFPAGSQAIIMGGFGAAPGFPCGVVIPVAGELLISLVPEPGWVQLPWGGAGTVTNYDYAVANNIALVGQTLNTQGILFTAGQIELTNALDLNFGTF